MVGARSPSLTSLSCPSVPLHGCLRCRNTVSESLVPRQCRAGCAGRSVGVACRVWDDALIRLLWRRLTESPSTPS
ncbi:hypothetical protein E2C01_008386 [Portunus trituberculatus]|uniref:Uncharacterized protein n=1 Tax=Portunus trituberculatus TaxID=210409 RepID=A0A5B7D283_PORTR|nr:hypothetical protein [Portunus trituberculatus]